MARESSITRDDNFFAGDARTVQWTVYDVDDPATQTPLNITGWTLDFELKLNESDTAALVSRLGFAPSTPASGLVDVVFAEADTTALQEATYVYTLRRVDVGFERVSAFGGFHIRRATLGT